MDNGFPIYRKSSNDRNWYKILDERHFIEVQKVGERYFSFKIVATQYPEMLRIKDMVSCVEGFVESTALDFEDVFSARDGADSSD